MDESAQDQTLEQAAFGPARQRLGDLGIAKQRAAGVERLDDRPLRAEADIEQPMSSASDACRFTAGSHRQTRANGRDDNLAAALFGKGRNRS